MFSEAKIQIEMHKTKLQLRVTPHSTAWWTVTWDTPLCV